MSSSLRVTDRRAIGALISRTWGRLNATTPRRVLSRLSRIVRSRRNQQLTEASHAPYAPASAQPAPPLVAEASHASDAPASAEPAAPLVFRPTLDRPTGEMIEINTAAAEKFGVTPAVHPKDFIYWFCATHPLKTTQTGIEYYFWTGDDSSRKVADLAASLGYAQHGQPIKLLEFASGYGCVTRHLIKNPCLELVSCDIHPEALEFLGKEMGVKTLASVPDPDQFTASEQYDVVFALSFFTHMPKSSFGRGLKALFSVLKSPGYLVFTTHGYKSCVGLNVKPEEIPADGFWFRPDSEQKDLDTAQYGVSLTTPDFVTREIERTLGAPIALHRQGYWWTEHDLWVVKRES